MLPGLLQDHSIATAAGATATTAIAVGGMKSTSAVLAVIKQKAGEAAAGVDVSDATAGDGTITFGTVDTSGYNLVIVYLPN